MTFTSLGCPYAERPGRFRHLRLALLLPQPPGFFRISWAVGSGWWELFDPSRQVRPFR